MINMPLQRTSERYALQATIPRLTRFRDVEAFYVGFAWRGWVAYA